MGWRLVMERLATIEEFNKCDAMRAIEGTPEERERIMQTARFNGNVTEFPDGSSLIANFGNIQQADHTSPSLTHAAQADGAAF